MTSTSHTSDGLASIGIGCPEDAIAAVPYLAGYQPSDELVIIGWAVDGMFLFSYDLVDRGGYPVFTAQLCSAMIVNRADAVILLGYGDHERALPMLTQAQDTLESFLTVMEVLHLSGGRWRSAMCSDIQCCPAEGRVYDVAATTIAARATLAGLAPFGSREDMAQTIAPAGGKDLMWIQAHTERAEAELLGRGPGSRRLAEVGIPLVRRLTRSPKPLTDLEAARLSVALTHGRVRAEAVKRIVRRDVRAQLAVWQDLTRRSAGAYAAEPAAMLALAAYMAGDGTLALMAIERCRKAAPEHPMADVVSDLLQQCTPPEAARAQLITRAGRLAIKPPVPVGT